MNSFFMKDREFEFPYSHTLTIQRRNFKRAEIFEKPKTMLKFWFSIFP